LYTNLAISRSFTIKDRKFFRAFEQKLSRRPWTDKSEAKRALEVPVAPPVFSHVVTYV